MTFYFLSCIGKLQFLFRYGISYHGAAQAASGTKEQVASYREKNRKLFEQIGQFSRSSRGSSSATDIASINDIGRRSEYMIGLKISIEFPLILNSILIAADSAFAPSTVNADNEEQYPDDDDYENDEGDDQQTGDTDGSVETTTKSRKKSSDRVEVELPKMILSNSTKDESSRPSISFRPTSVRSETIPEGFKGKVESRKSTSKPNSLFSETDKPDTFVTVTKSVTGTLDSSKDAPSDDKKFSSTYYTKSSTCGYFTFSCNVVYGANGRSKICRPKTPADGKC